MAKFADLEVTLRKRTAKTYSASFRYNGADDESEHRFPSDDSVAIDPSSLRDLLGDDYAAALSEAFFTPIIRTSYGRAIDKAEAESAVLRVRLSLEKSAAELHELHWEMLRDPRAEERPLFLGENVIFSRYLASSRDWRPIRLRPKSELRALIAIASPSDLDAYELAPIPIAEELENAKKALGPIPVTVLASGDATLENLSSHLREGFDIVYLLCHGRLTKSGDPVLFLDGTEPADGRELAENIREMKMRPRLVMLASCESAKVAGDALLALGPLLAEVGVPAVIAMQDCVTMETASRFATRFFEELVKGDGQIDRAVAIARGSVRDRLDAWMPALLMRLRNGRLWYVPGFAGEKSEFEQWQSIRGFVNSGDCVPILGPDLTEEVFGSTRGLASDIASDKEYPLEFTERSDLAKVAQYLSSLHSPQYARDTVRDALVARLTRNSRRLLGQATSTVDTGALMQMVAAKCANSESDPLRIAAQLNARVFVNASGTGLFNLVLRKAELEGARKKPVEIAVRWREDRRDDPKRLARLDEPTVEAPLLYYVFGKIQEPDTWVLTEDDFFDYLIQTARFNLMPTVVSDALVSGSLLLLGFPLDDWKFRVLFRLIRAKGGSALLNNFNHVAVQVDPAETTLANARRAKRYMERYFRDSKIDIYWGTAADFLRDLDRQLKRAPNPVDAGAI